MIKPSRLLLFLTACLVALGVVSLLFPVNGISIGNATIQFPQLAEVFAVPVPKVKVNIDSITKQTIDTNITIKKDTIIVEGRAVVVADTIHASNDSLVQVAVPIEFPNDSVEMFDKLFFSLQHLTDTGGVVRIIHYGDSQIEADHITGMFRQLMQSRFGGYGCGLLPMFANSDVALPVPLTQSGAWKRFTAYGKRDTSIHHNRYGAMLAFSRFSSQKPDSLNAAPHKALVHIERSNYAFARRGRYRILKLFYGAAPGKTEVSFKSADSAKHIAHTDSMKAGVLRFAAGSYTLWSTLQFTGKNTPDWYALSLEDSAGVLVDNVPLRGCSGLDFTHQSSTLLREIYTEMKPKLFILEFGVNVSAYGNKDYGFYEKGLIKQINYLKQLCPQAAVLVVGISDVSYKEGESYITNPTVPLIRAAQRNAAFATGSAYWDLFTAMGGENSMEAWVNAEHPLAQKDFTHFNASGANVVGKLLYNAFIQQYANYQKRKKKV